MFFPVEAVVRGWRVGLCVVAFCLSFGLALRQTSASQTNSMPDGPGKAETQKMCSTCHELDKSLSLKQDRAGWQRTVEKMLAFGLSADDDQVKLVVDYLARNYAADEVPRLKVNSAEAIEFESILSLKRSQALAVIEYRKKHGPFKSLADLKKVPGIEAAKLDEKKDRLIFE